MPAPATPPCPRLEASQSAAKLAATEKGLWVDTEAEAKKPKAMPVAALLFLVSAWFAWGEPKYAMAGTTTEGMVIRTCEKRGRRGCTIHNIASRCTNSGGESIRDSD